MQEAQNIFLVRPSCFSFNIETAGSNAFQKNTDLSPSLLQNVISEFNSFAAELRREHIGVLVFDDTGIPVKPDAVFPNNWISLHPGGTLILYSMFAPNRRTERRDDIIEEIKNKFIVTNTIDLSVYEKENKFLEGTGSIVFDHKNGVAYACLSPRTDEGLFLELCRQLNYSPVCFVAHDEKGKEIYHTNVMMCICEGIAVICADSITTNKGREAVLSSLKKGGLSVIEISFEQMNHFAGNMLGLKNKEGESILVLSQSAHNCLTENQIQEIQKNHKLLPLSIPTIETIGGGSARCMIAEVFLAPKN